MATAICGGVKGADHMRKEDIALLKEANHIDFAPYAKIIAEKRGNVK